MTLFDTIKQLILRYTASEMTLAMFRDQFVPLYLSANRASDLEAVAFADRIENLYADLLAGEIDEAQFSRKLNAFYPMITLGPDPESAFANSTGSTFDAITGNRRSVSNDAYTVMPQYAECV